MANPQKFTTSKGKPYPFGISANDEGLNFALTSKHARAVTLCLFDRETKLLVLEIPLLPQNNKTGHVWHIHLQGLRDNMVYAYRVLPPAGNMQELLLDPYAKAVATPHAWGGNCSLAEAPKNHYVPYGEILPATTFDWGTDSQLHIPLADLVIYEMHVRAFTIHPSSKVAHPGTYLGVIEKIPHLLELGVNAVELMPMQEFNELEYARAHPTAPKLLYNFWGYSTVNFFSPMNRYATSDARGAAVEEFKTMVRELHRHGIEIILDIVFNHTAEGNENGPIISFKGIDNAIYYMLDHHLYRDFTGCGNTVNTNHAAVQELIINCLRYWVTEMHVDGFRFDLASIFSRDSKGIPLSLAPIVKAITEDPILADTKLIAEPWDAAGLYQVGSFAGKSPRWLEWNDKYRDCVRRFIKGMPGTNGDFAKRLSGSEDLYHDRSPCHSINFVTAHDGFTLADLVSYNMKHNMDNGEQNQDGTNHNESWNHGIEGPTDDPAILQLRRQQMRNLHLALMLSQGTPMLLMGDEYAHSKNGNNNTWCHDSELNWFLWDRLQANSGFLRFYKGLIRFRKQHPIVRRNTFLTADDIDWHGVRPMQIEWHSNLALVAFTLKDHENRNDLYAAFNAQHAALSIQLPAPPEGKSWHWVVDTAAPSPNDFFADGQGPIMKDNIFTMTPYSAILLEALPA